MKYQESNFVKNAEFFLYPGKFEWRTCLIISAIIVLLLSIWADPVQAEPLLHIIDIAWTDEIDPARNPVRRYEARATSEKPLYLWTNVRGGQEAFEKLKKKRKLTITHKWRSNYFGWKTDEINVSIGRDQQIDDVTLDKLEYELHAQGYFDWRTWSKKTHVSAGTYSVSIVDGFDDQFPCYVEHSCEMTITIVE